MKQKIKEAITQGYKHLGVPESVVDGLAALGVTVVKDESGIEGFVNGEAFKGVMKSYQSEADKVRTEYSNKLKAAENAKAELEAKLGGNNPEPPKPQTDPAEMAKLIAEAVAGAVKPLSDKIAGFESEQSAKAALAAAEQTFKSNDYVKKYADEAADAWDRAADAWDRAVEVYNATGAVWKADELSGKAMGYFNRAVSRKGVDTSKPFDGGGNADTDEDKAKAVIGLFKQG